MSDYATLLRDHMTLTCRSVDRMFLQAYVRSCSRWARCARSWGGSGASRSLVGSVRQDWRRVHQGGRALRKGARDPDDPLQEGREQGGVRPPVHRGGRRRGRRGEGGADRDRSGEGVGVAVVEGQGPRASGPPAHGVGPADGVHQPLLLLPVGPGLGTGVLEDQRLCAVADVDLPQRPEWAKRQLDKAGIVYEALDNGFRSCENPRPATRL